jgi:hypothetical protein
MLRSNYYLRMVIQKNPSNYRPISLLTSFSKIFEMIIYSRLNQNRWDNNILANDSMVLDYNYQI